MDLKLYALTFKVGICITKAIFLKKIMEIFFDDKPKYIAQAIYNKKNPLPIQRSSQRWRSTTIKYCHLKHYAFIN